jgi:transposase
LLRQVPCIGPIRAAQLVALMQTPHRFRTKRQLWTYSGLGLETRDSAQYCYVEGQLQRSKKPQQLRGLNSNHNHDLKNIFKGAATTASVSAGPFHDFYQALLTKGMRPTMARLTLARKIAAITLIVWKKGARLCAGINRHEVENARVLRERTSDSPGPEFCAAHREVHSEA